MNSTKLCAALTGAFLLMSGCVEIPDDDIEFLDRKIPVGMDASQAQEIVTRRGFEQAQIMATAQSRFDKASQRFKQLPLSKTDIVKQNIGFVELDGQPDGELTCFARGYVRFIASGDRLICWTVDEDGKIRWRQAGWRGAML